MPSNGWRADTGLARAGGWQNARRMKQRSVRQRGTTFPHNPDLEKTAECFMVCLHKALMRMQVKK
jgi:hypothetical protein